MKLGTLRNATRDGRLVVVSRDITRCSDAHHIAPTLQSALDNWDRVAPHLDLIARGVESGGQPTKRFHEREAHSPLPRAYQWIDASSGAGEPALRQRASDAFPDPRAALRATDAVGGVEISAGVAVILGDVPIGADIEVSLAAIRLVMLFGLPLLSAEDVSAATFSPVAVTPDELGDAWSEGRLIGAPMVDLNGSPVVRPDDSGAVFCDFPRLIAHAARARPLAAGSILSVGTVAGFGDTLRIQMRDVGGHAIFGAIEQTVEHVGVPA